MKKLEIIIRPHKLEEVRDALTAVGVQGVTVTQIKGFGRQKGKTEIYHGNEYSITFNPKVRLEVLIPDAILEQLPMDRVHPRRMKMGPFAPNRSPSWL